MPIYEVKKIEGRDLYLIGGLPDVGLVGTLATIHLIKQFKMEEVGYYDSNKLPPILVLDSGLPKSPVRIFSHRNIMVLTSEVALPLNVFDDLANSIIEFAVEKKFRAVIMITGLITRDRIDVEVPRVFGAASSEEGLKLLKNAGIELMNEGYLAGINALILKKAASKGVTSIVLMAQSFEAYPDPGAAASALESLAKIIGITIDVEKLRKEEEILRVKLRELMKRTREVMDRITKIYELQKPALMYV